MPALNFVYNQFQTLSRFEKKEKPYDVQPTLWMFIGLTILVGSLIGKSLAATEIIAEVLR